MNEHQKEYTKLLVNSMYDTQKVRVAIGNRIDAFLRTGGVGFENMAKELDAEIAALVRDMETAIEKRIARAMESAEIMKWLKRVRGIGPRYSGSLIALIGSPPDTVSKMWELCGMGVIPVCQSCGRIAFQGESLVRFATRQAERRWEQYLKKDLEEDEKDEESFQRKAYLETVAKLCQCDAPDVKEMAPQRKFYKGLLLTHNPFLKMSCWKISGQFVRQGKFYRTIYEKQKEFYSARDGDILSPGHIENRARRATVKLFLSHLWEMWRKSLGMDAGEFYLRHKLGSEFDLTHTYIAPPYSDMFDQITG